MVEDAIVRYGMPGKDDLNMDRVFETRRGGSQSWSTLARVRNDEDGLLCDSAQATQLVERPGRLHGYNIWWYRMISSFASQSSMIISRTDEPAEQATGS